MEAQIVQKRKNDEARPKFTGSYKKKRVPHYRNFSFPTIASDCPLQRRASTRNISYTPNL